MYILKNIKLWMDIYLTTTFNHAYNLEADRLVTIALKIIKHPDTKIVKDNHEMLIYNITLDFRLAFWNANKYYAQFKIYTFILNGKKYGNGSIFDFNMRNGVRISKRNLYLLNKFIISHKYKEHTYLLISFKYSNNTTYEYSKYLA